MTSTREAMTLLREANPVPPTGSLDDPRTDARPYVAAGRLSRLGVALAGVAALAVVALALGVVPLPWTHGNASPAAAAALDKAATAADITARDEAARPDQYWRIRTRGTHVCYCETGTVLLRGTRTEYLAVDGSRPSWIADKPSHVVRVLGGSPNAGNEIETGASETWTTNLAPNDSPGNWQSPSAAWLANVPRDTAGLRDRLYDDTSGHGRSHDGEVLVYVADALRSGAVPADLRAALFRVLETVPGVDIVQRHKDGLISIGRLETTDGQRQELVIDPDTGEYIGERTIQVESQGNVPAGTVVGDVSVSRTIVDGVPAAFQAEAVHQTCTASADGAVICAAS